MPKEHSSVLKRHQKHSMSFSVGRFPAGALQTAQEKRPFNSEHMSIVRGRVVLGVFRCCFYHAMAIWSLEVSSNVVCRDKCAKPATPAWSAVNAHMADFLQLVESESDRGSEGESPLHQLLDEQGDALISVSMFCDRRPSNSHSHPCCNFDSVFEALLEDAQPQQADLLCDNI